VILCGGEQDQEKELIEAALGKSRGKVAGSTLESQIKQLRIEKGRFNGPS
jgi:hypothetical protein